MITHTFKERPSVIGQLYTIAGCPRGGWPKMSPWEQESGEDVHGPSGEAYARISCTHEHHFYLLCVQQRGDVRHADLCHGPGRFSPACLGSDESVRADGNSIASRVRTDVRSSRATFRNDCRRAGVYGAVRVSAPVRWALAGCGSAGLPGCGAGGVPPVRAICREPPFRARKGGPSPGRDALCVNAFTHGWASRVISTDK